MHRQPLLNNLKRFKESPFFTHDEQEDFHALMAFITDNPGCFDREHPGHITGSVWIINHDATHALLTHHKKLEKWLQLGGHADSDPDIKRVALKEAHEESGILELTFVTPNIFDIDIHPIPKNSCIAHYDIRYLLKAGPHAQYIVSEESHDLAWVPLEQISEYTTSPSVLRMAHKAAIIIN